MTGYEIAVFAAKFAFGSAAFLLIGFIGASDDKRVAGAMLAFPTLNGIGMVTSLDRDPVALAAAMMPMIAFNGILFFAFIVAFRALRQWLRGAGDRALSYGVGVAGAAIWFLIAWCAAPWLAPLVPPAWWIVLYGVLTAVMTIAFWSRGETARTSSRIERPAFAPFWRARLGRVGFFAVSLFLLLVVANVGTAEWIGRLSALPLVPLCVLAGIAIDDRDSLPMVRDPIFVGPWLSMFFVAGLMQALLCIRPAGELAYWTVGIAGLALGWTLCFLAFRYGVPPLAAALDRRRR